jgi:hypothetical protein
VKSSGLWLISEQAGSPLTEPLHGWSLSTAKAKSPGSGDD